MEGSAGHRAPVHRHLLCAAQRQGKDRGVSRTSTPPTVKASATITAPLRKKRRSMFSMDSYRRSAWVDTPADQPMLRSISGPLQPREDRASHHPVLVALGQEAQLFGDMGDALPPGRPRELVGQVGSPVAALRPVGVEYAAQRPMMKDSRKAG